MEEKTKILEMLASGKISVDEAEKLLNAIGASSNSKTGEPVKKKAKFLRVEINSQMQGREDERVSVRVPFNLLRAGVKLAALIPKNVQGHVSEALEENGIDVDLSKIKPDDLEDIMTQLEELQVDVDSGGDKVRVFVE